MKNKLKLKLTHYKHDDSFLREDNCVAKQKNEVEVSWEENRTIPDLRGDAKYTYTHRRQKRGGKRRLRLKYGPKPFILLSVLYPGIYLQTAANPPPRQQEKFKAISINVSSSFVFRRRFATDYEKKNKILRCVQ